eukprot:TRINITY_DN2235_c0_g1_i1.p1 TRINITY_DN2235_c0_g1~~TRINITY_DN2235_c0_g1_i1.p1  ORF type:complete len:332 (-),score=45.50 TRINITY_DN2235_c0_g1_i1:76-1071(-)
MSRWTNTARNLQRAVPLGVISGASSPPSPNTGCNDPSDPSICASLPSDAQSSTAVPSTSFYPQHNQQAGFEEVVKSTTQPPLAFSSSEISSLREDLRSTSEFLPEEKRQLLEGLFDLAHDPILQHQVLNNPAFGRILNAATRLPMTNSTLEERERLRIEQSQRNNSNYNQNLRGSMSGGFPEVQGTLVFDSTQSSAGWSVMIRASLPSVPSNHSCNTMVCENSSTNTNAPSFASVEQLHSNTFGHFSMPNDVYAHSETLFQRVFAYVSSLWSWLWPDYHRSKEVPSSSFSTSTTTTTNTTNSTPLPSPEKINRIKMWSILGTTMIMLALSL